jgi:hypothetical protein
MILKLDYSPHPNQLLVHNAIEDPTKKFICLVGSRQWGKTKALLMSAVKQSFNDPDCKTTMIVSPTDNQSKRLYDILYKGLEVGHLLRGKTSKPGDYTLNLVNGSKIKFKSAKQEDNIRGNNVDFLILDEGGYIPSSTVYTILMPMIVTKKNAKMLVVSTPNGKNWFYDFYKSCGNSPKDSASFLFTYRDNPLVNMEIIDKFRNTLPEHIFQQEFECSFNDGASVFSNIHKCIIDKKDIKPYTYVYVGIDVGMLNDFTVVSLISDKGQLVDMLRFTGLQVDEMIFQINKFLSKYHIKRIMIEDNNQGVVIYQLLKKHWNEKIVPFNTNSKTKPMIITDLITSFSQSIIKIIENKDLIGELEDFDYSINRESGKIRYAARSGHDDTVIALAIAWYNFKRRYTTDGVPLHIL